MRVKFQQLNVLSSAEIWKETQTNPGHFINIGKERVSTTLLLFKDLDLCTLNNPKKISLNEDVGCFLPLFSFLLPKPSSRINKKKQKILSQM